MEAPHPEEAPLHAIAPPEGIEGEVDNVWNDGWCVTKRPCDARKILGRRHDRIGPREHPASPPGMARHELRHRTAVQVHDYAATSEARERTRTVLNHEARTAVHLNKYDLNAPWAPHKR